jgi:thermostable 8-oxoguanine DNA glycosylase
MFASCVLEHSLLVKDLLKHNSSKEILACLPSDKKGISWKEIMHVLSQKGYFSLGMLPHRRQRLAYHNSKLAQAKVKILSEKSNKAERAGHVIHRAHA